MMSFETYLRRFYGAKSTKKQKPNRPIAKFGLDCYQKLLLAENTKEAIINLVEMRDDLKKIWEKPREKKVTYVGNTKNKSYFFVQTVDEKLYALFISTYEDFPYHSYQGLYHDHECPKDLQGKTMLYITEKQYLEWINSKKQIVK